jgi:hypothetical protein
MHKDDTALGQMNREQLEAIVRRFRVSVFFLFRDLDADAVQGAR